MEQSRKIGVVTSSSMVALAFVFDVISVIPIINLVSGFVAWLLFATWFYLIGLGLANPRRIGTMAVSFLAELIPFVSMLPTITLGVIAIIMMHNHPTATNLISKRLSGNKKEAPGPTPKREATLPSIQTKAPGPVSTQQPQNNSNQKQTLADIVPIKIQQPQTPNYPKVPNQEGLPVPQRRRLPPDVTRPAPYGEEDEEIRKAA